MKKNKYLDDLGLEREKYGVNGTYKKEDDRYVTFKEQKKTYGFTEIETWALGYHFAEWLYSRLMMYKEVACVKLDYHKFDYKGVEYTQEELIDRMILLLGEYLKCEHRCILPDCEEKLQEAAEIWAIVLPAMWW